MSEYFDKELHEGNVSRTFVNGAFSSVARTAVVQMQDLLALDNSARMNVPGVSEGNWGWRLEQGHYDRLEEVSATVMRQIELSNRLP